MIANFVKIGVVKVTLHVWKYIFRIFMKLCNAVRTESRRTSKCFVKTEEWLSSFIYEEFTLEVFIFLDRFSEIRYRSSRNAVQHSWASWRLAYRKPHFTCRHKRISIHTFHSSVRYDWKSGTCCCWTFVEFREKRWKGKAVLCYWRNKYNYAYIRKSYNILKVKKTFAKSM